MHNVWVCAVAGALETRIRYSATLCYNTFPVSPLPKKQHELLSERAFAVLEAREHHSHKTLAQLYDPEKMPGELREAHQFSTRRLTSCIGSGPSSPMTSA